MEQTDKAKVLRSKNIRLIPPEEYRIGGKKSYAEWAYTVGVFQTLIFQNKPNGAPAILDIGCGTGIMAIAANPFIVSGGSYTGIDVREEDIQFCKEHYPSDGYTFKHVENHNELYRPGNRVKQKPWPVPESHFDIVTALSFFTHLSKADAIFFMRQAERALKPGGRVISTFFYLDSDYIFFDEQGHQGCSEYNGTKPERWKFSEKVYGADSWFCPEWANPPEQAIGVTPAGIGEIVEKSGLMLREVYSGNWKEKPGVYFQDILIFEKVPTTKARFFRKK